MSIMSNELFGKEFVNASIHVEFFTDMRFCENLLNSLLFKRDEIDFNVVIRFNKEFGNWLHNDMGKNQMIFYFKQNTPSSFIVLKKFHDYSSYLVDLYEITKTNSSELSYEITSYRNIGFEDIRSVMKLAVDIAKIELNKSYFTKQESFVKLFQFVKDHYSKDYLQILDNIGYENGNLYNLFKFVDNKNKNQPFLKFVDNKNKNQPFLMVDNRLSNHMYLYTMTDEHIDYVRYFNKAINYSGYHTMSDFLDRIEDTDE